MDKKIYETPTIEVVELQQESVLLMASGGVGATRSGYGESEDETWE